MTDELRPSDTEEPRPSSLVRDTLPGEAPRVPATHVASVAEVQDALYDVVDPELMVNIVDLGLVYGITVDEFNDVTIDMTLTSPTCPLTDRLEWDIHSVLEGIVESVTINWVWLPPWTLDNITEDGREQLRSIGYNV